MSTPSINLIREFTDENVALLVGYFVVNILTLILETIVISVLLSKIFSSLEKGGGGKGTSVSYDTGGLFMKFVGVFVLVRLGYFLKSIIYDEITPKFFYFLRTNLYDKIIDRYRVDYKELNTGYVLYNFEHLPSSFKKLMTELLQEYIPNVLALIVCLCYLFYMNKVIGGIVLFGIIALIMIVGLTIGKSIELGGIQHGAFESDNSHIQDRVNNLFDIYTSGTETQEKQEFVGLEQTLEHAMKDDYMYITMATSMMEVFSILILATSFFTLYKVYRAGTMSTENIITIILVLSYFLTYFSKISSSYISLSDVFGYSLQSDRFIKEITSQPIPSSPPTNHSIFHGPIEIKNLHFKYGEGDSKISKILNNVNLYVKPGSKIAIYGKSGSGKSTLIKLLLGFYTMGEGSISIGGKDIKDIDLSELRRNISVVNQNNRLFDKSIMENMTYGLPENEDISEDDIKKIIGNQNIFSNITGGLNSNVGTSGSKLSGGQKQMIVLGRAILKATPILILDEPTSALDKNTKTNILNIIKNLKNKTVIIITHDDSIERIVDKSYIMVNGKLQVKN